MTDVIDRFSAMSATEINEYFCKTDVLEITEMICAASDEELGRLLELDHFRNEAIDAILDRFDEFSDRDRLAEVDGVVRFELARSKKKSDCHTARFSGGKVTLEPEATPDVTVAAEICDFVRLATGQSNAALLYLGGRLGITGHELLALAVGSVFTVPPHRPIHRERDRSGRRLSEEQPLYEPFFDQAGERPSLGRRLRLRRFGEGARQIDGCPHTDQRVAPRDVAVPADDDCHALVVFTRFPVASHRPGRYRRPPQICGRPRRRRFRVAVESVDHPRPVHGAQASRRARG